MKPEVKEAVAEWLCGAIIGMIPLIAHAFAFFVLTPPPEKTGVDGNWAIDVLFIAITLSSTSLVSVVNRLRKSGRTMVQGRAAIWLTAITALFLIIASIAYGGEAIGSAQPNTLFIAIGLVIGAGFLSMYLEFTLANGAANAKPPPRRKKAAPKPPEKGT